MNNKGVQKVGKIGEYHVYGDFTEDRVIKLPWYTRLWRWLFPIRIPDAGYVYCPYIPVYYDEEEDDVTTDKGER